MALVTIGFNPAIDRILECGDFHVGGHQSVRQIARLAAGKAANINRALALLGVDSIAMGFLGMEELEFFHTELMATGPGRILCRFIEVGGKTRENISILDTDRHVETHLRDQGFAVVPAERALLEKKLAHELHAGDVAIFAGSLCDGCAPEFLVRLIQLCNAQGAKVAVDSSGPALSAAAGQKLWLIKPNVDELGALLGTAPADTPAALGAAARPLLAHIDQILISRGRQGAVLVTREGIWAGGVPAAAPAVRTVGCGDHLLAAYVAERMAGRDPEPALRLALAVATVRATSTDMSEFSLDAVKATLGAVEVVGV